MRIMGIHQSQQVENPLNKSISKPTLRKAAAVAKEVGVAVEVKPDGTIIYTPIAAAVPAEVRA